MTDAQEKWANNFLEKAQNDFLNEVVLQFNKITTGNTNLKLLSVENYQANPDIKLLLVFHAFLKETLVWMYNTKTKKISKYPHTCGNIVKRKSNE
jgi:hypothetical protein